MAAAPESEFAGPILHASGRERFISWSHAVIRDEDGGVVSALCSGVDITESLSRAASKKSSDMA